MSHFVSSKGKRDFEDLEQQLLRREPVHHEEDEAEEEVEEAVEGPEGDDGSGGRGVGGGDVSTSRNAKTRLSATASPSSSTTTTPPPSRPLSPRTPRPAVAPASPLGVTRSSMASTSARSPSYSRTNSPERQERPRSPGIQRMSTSGGGGGGGSSRPRSLYEGVVSRQAEKEKERARGKDGGGGKIDPASAAASASASASRHVAFSQNSPQKYDAQTGPYAIERDANEQDALLAAHDDNALLASADPRTHAAGNAHARRNTGMIDQAEVPKKLGTWDGVFVPVTLNILGVILFLRFGFILGQAGLVGALALLVISYTIDALTSMSISAISTNGVVRAGGIFYLASRSLGPEFGGATGLLFWLGQALNASLNALGFVETLTDAFGQSREEGGARGIPEGPWWSFAYGSFVLLAATVICLVGSRLFVRATMILAVILAVAIASIPISSLVVNPYLDEERGLYYTGWSLSTLRSNLLPHFTADAAGSATPGVKEDWSTVFGVLFPAVTGVLAGASMSGDLRKPSKSIPKGTNWSLLSTFIVYAVVFVVLAGTTARTSFYNDIGVMGDIAAVPFLITIGALASTAFSALMGVQACGKVLQAIARDHLLPLLDVFAQGTEVADTPTYGILATYLVCQAVLFVDSVNLIAQLVTMTSLLCFAVLSFACLALKAGGAPSFRPSFPYFNIYTAAAGATLSLVAMFFTDGTAASACILLAIVLFGAIHVFSPPKPWGDVTRNVHYWLTRKYLLRLDERKTNLKHWRPQVLLLANNPRSEWNLIIFCNSLKKGGLYVLGHCIKGEFGECLSELRKQQIAWLKLVDLSGIKSFVDVVIANDEREGARSLILSAGLGGMRPNIVVLGFPRDLRAHARVAPLAHANKRDESEITIRGPHAPQSRGGGSGLGHLPTDATRKESPITAAAYVGIIEDALALNKAVAVAYGFDMMQLPGPSSTARYEKSRQRQYIDLWPIQIASPDSDPEHAWDTYTMVLQLGTILSLTGTWKSHQLRVNVFVEEASEVDEERKRVRSLLDNLRIPASLRVFCLSDGTVVTYETIVRGAKTGDAVPPFIEEALRHDPWWTTLKDLRKEDAIRAKAAAAAAAAAAARRKAEAEESARQSPTPSSSSASLTPQQRTKREQKMLGYSLPPEHMEYFKRNIRIGLSHPRAKPRVDDSDVEDDDDSGSDDSDGSGLSDELLRLGEDDFWSGGGGGGGGGASSSGQRANRRSKSFSQGHSGSGRRAGSHGHAPSSRRHLLPDEPTHRAHAPAFTPSSSYGSMSSTPLVSEDGTLRARMQRERDASVTEVDGDATVRGRSGGGGSRGSLPSGMDSGREGTFKAQTAEASSSSRRQSTSSTLAAGDAGENDDVDATTWTPSSHPRSLSASDGLQYDAAAAAAAAPRLPSTASSTTPLTPHLTFNTLPNKAQFLILNELFRAHSSSAETSVILTSLPAPEAGTAASEERVQRYLGRLEVLCAGSVPVLGIHARELTLSMSL